MTGCRASALLAAFAAAAWPAFALAQGGPIRLTPPPIVDQQPLGQSAPPPAAAPVPDSPAPPAPESGTSVREEGVLAPLDPDAIGLIDEGQGGLPATLWAGSRRLEIDKLLAEGGGAQASPALRALLRRALVSAGAPPDPAGADTPLSFLGLRAQRLLRLGDAEDALRLARAGGRQAGDAMLERARRDAAFLAGEADAACATVREAVARESALDWSHALIACQALAGDFARAQLGLEIQREAKQSESPWLPRLVAAAAGDARALAAPPAAPLPAWGPALLAAAKLAPPPPSLASADPAMLAAIAALPSAAAEQRLAAAERAAALGALAPEALAEAYAGATIPARDVAEALAFADRERGPRGRAALFQRLRNEPAGPVRADALRRALRLAQARGAGAAFAAAVAPLAAEIPPVGELALVAPDLARALVAHGHAAEALAWHEALRGFGGAPALDAAALIGPLLWLGGVDDHSLISIEALAEWRLAQDAVDRPRATARAATLALLLDSLGEPAASLLPSASTVAPEVDERLAAAAKGGRRGETVLLAAAAVGPEGVARTAPARLAAVLRALVDAGLPAEARALALEAALAAGL